MQLLWLIFFSNASLISDSEIETAPVVVVVEVVVVVVVVVIVVVGSTAGMLHA